MRSIAVTGFAVFLSAAGALSAAAAPSLTVLCPLVEVWCTGMETAFEKKTGIDVKMVRKSMGEGLQLLRDEKGAPSIDVWWGGTGDTHLQAGADDLLEPYFSINQQDLLPWAQNYYTLSRGRSAGLYAGALGISYNSRRLKALGLPAPACWKDLTADVYRGAIQMGDPRFSGTAYTTLATLVQLFGEDEAFSYFAKLHKNIDKYTAVGVAPLQAAARGETTIAIAFLHDAVTMREAGAPLVIVAPCEGTGYEIGAVSIIKGTRNLDAARNFVDFALSVEGETVGAATEQNQIPSNVKASVPAKAPDLSLIKTVDYDFALFGSPAERSRLLKKFAAAIATN